MENGCFGHPNSHENCTEMSLFSREKPAGIFVKKGGNKFNFFVTQSTRVDFTDYVRGLAYLIESAAAEGVQVVFFRLGHE